MIRVTASVSAALVVCVCAAVVATAQLRTPPPTEALQPGGSAAAMDARAIATAVMRKAGDADYAGVSEVVALSPLFGRDAFASLCDQLSEARRQIGTVAGDYQGFEVVRVERLGSRLQRVVCVEYYDHFAAGWDMVLFDGADGPELQRLTMLYTVEGLIPLME